MWRRTQKEEEEGRKKGKTLVKSRGREMNLFAAVSVNKYIGMTAVPWWKRGTMGWRWEWELLGGSGERKEG